MKFKLVSVIFAVILACLFATELAYRFIKGPIPSEADKLDSLCIPDKILGYRFRPGAVPPQGKEANCINNAGFRGDDIKVPKDKNTYRILCIGDSATNGVNVHNEETYPQILQYFLSHTKFNTDIKVEVVNAGIPGYISDHHRYLLEKKYLQLEPDLIISMMGVTDVTAILEANTAWDTIRHVTHAPNFLPAPIENFLQKHSSAYYWGSHKLQDYLDLKRLEATGKNDLTPELEKALATYKTNYQNMINICKEHNIKTININYPWNFTSHVGREDNYNDLKKEIKYFEFNLYWQARPILSRINKEITTSNDIPNLDFQKLILDSKNRFIFFGDEDFTHPSIAGNFLIATQVYNYMMHNTLADKVLAPCDYIKPVYHYLLGIPFQN